MAFRSTISSTRTSVTLSKRDWTSHPSRSPGRYVGRRVPQLASIIRVLTNAPQVVSLMEWPALAELAPDAFPKDVVARAHELQSEIGSVGAYSHSQGVPHIRKSVASFIQGALFTPYQPHSR